MTVWTTFLVIKIPMEKALVKPALKSNLTYSVFDFVPLCLFHVQKAILNKKLGVWIMGQIPQDFLEQNFSILFELLYLEC